MRYVKITLLLALLSMIHSQESTSIPEWVMPGILATETKSYYGNTGQIRYVDKRRGSSGERGCFQMTQRAFDQVKKRGEQFWMIEQDTVFAAEMAWRYLHWLNKHYGHGDWGRVVEMYNAGPNNRSRAYLIRVKENS